MQTLNKHFTLFAMGVSAFCLIPNASFAKGDQYKMEYDFRILEKRVSLLENDEITYGPITVSHIRLNNSKHFAVVKPGQTIDCSFEYQLDSSKQEFLTKNHLIVGLKGVAAEACATHLYGVWDSHGNASFKLTTPIQRGDYEVRIAYRPGDTCQDALNSWTILKDEPGSYATIGFLRVQ